MGKKEVKVGVLTSSDVESRYGRCVWNIFTQRYQTPELIQAASGGAFEALQPWRFFVQQVLSETLPLKRSEYEEGF